MFNVYEVHKSVLLVPCLTALSSFTLFSLARSPSIKSPVSLLLVLTFRRYMR